jgi:hypothetical protein
MKAGHCPVVYSPKLGDVSDEIVDTIWYDDARTVLATNYSFVERIMNIAGILER